MVTKRLLVALLLAPVLALAQAPQTLHYQGYLTSSVGAPVNGATQITFKLYDVASGGSALWSETHAAVNIANGNYQVILGNLVPFGLDFSAQYWLGVTAGADAEMSPRQALTMVPYAYRAVTADSLSAGATIQGSQISGTIGNAVVPGAVPWVVVGGASQTMQRNTAYMATAPGVIAFTLPASAQIGDVVKVVAQGAGGWTLAATGGQRVGGAGLPMVPGLVGTARDVNRQWQKIASSADGTKLVAVVLDGKIYTSTDSGANWSPREADRQWSSVASSADGTKLVATVSAGQVYTSIDSGVNWTPRDSARSWVDVASSADGTKLAAVVSNGQIYTSVDSGATWDPRDSARTWLRIASSADGTKLLAAAFNGQIYTSVDSGEVWTPRESTRGWRALASSADGVRLAAASAGGGGIVFVSEDAGVTWTTRITGLTQWRSLASSADGTRLAAVSAGDPLYISENGGLSWTTHDSGRTWQSVASSADGTKLVAAEYGGPIYTLNPKSLMVGGQYALVEVMYAGSGEWKIVNKQGTVTVQ